jgi:hypothetical protein
LRLLGAIPEDVQMKQPAAAVTGAQRRATPAAGLTARGGRPPHKGVTRGLGFEAANRGEGHKGSRARPRIGSNSDASIRNTARPRVALTLARRAM